MYKMQMIKKKTIRIPLTAKETMLLDEVCSEYTLQRATVLQIYFTAAWKEFQKRQSSRIYIMRRQDIESYEDAVVIRIDPGIYDEVKSASKKMIMSVPGFLRYLIMPMLQERQVIV